MIEPIRPENVVDHKKDIVPDWVIWVWNGLIVKNFISGRSRVLESDAVGALLVEALRSQKELSTTISRDLIYKSGWLDIEDIYRKSGWSVVYDKPGFNEDYPASFTFVVPR